MTVSPYDVRRTPGFGPLALDGEAYETARAALTAIVRADADGRPDSTKAEAERPRRRRGGHNPLVLPSQYPEVVPYPLLRRLLQAQADMLFGDLRTLLCLPGEADGLDAGCNLTAAVLAVNIAAGASVLFWDSSIEALEKRGDRKRRFDELMGAMYPWGDDDAVNAELGAKLLYDYARSPLTHTLGIGKTRRLFPGISGDEREVWLSKPQKGLDAAVADEVLSSRERPVWLDPTVRSGPDGYTVSVVTLAWGVHRMLRNLFANEEQAKGAEATARALFGG